MFRTPHKEIGHDPQGVKTEAIDFHAIFHEFRNILLAQNSIYTLTFFQRQRLMSLFRRITFASPRLISEIGKNLVVITS